jgi:hypothetical protein
MQEKPIDFLPWRSDRSAGDHYARTPDAKLYVGTSVFPVYFDSDIPLGKLRFIPVTEWSGERNLVWNSWRDMRVIIQLVMHPRTLERLNDLCKQQHVPPLPAVAAETLPASPEREPRPIYARDRRATLKRQALGLGGRARYRRVR